MKHFDYIYDIATDNYGIVTAAQAREEGIAGAELNRWCKNGWLDRRGQGVYKLTRWVPTPYDSYAEALALVGEGSYLRGESVLAMHDLALVDPRAFEVAAPRRVRKNLPPWVEPVPARKGERTTFYDGIRSQRVADAIRECRSFVMPDRLADAARKARQEGLITAREYEDLEKELA